MLTVFYQYQFEYAYDVNGKLFPQLGFQISSPAQPQETIDAQLYLDVGAERSFLTGRIGVALGIDILDGKPVTYQTGAGSLFSATAHKVQLTHPDLGTFDIEVAFSSTTIPRNLLGRDFFDLVQIGFRERHATFYVTPAP